MFQINTSVQTTVWLGSYHTTGGYSANVSGPLQYNATKAKWVWLVSPSDPGTLPFRVAITRPGTGGMRIAETQPDPTISTGASQVNGTNLHAEWDGDRVTLYAENGEYTGSTWATREDFEKSGVTIRFEGPNGAVQAHLLPDRFTNTKTLSSLGLTRLGNGLYFSPTNTRSGILEIPSSDAARGLDAPLRLAIYGNPGNG